MVPEEMTPDGLENISEKHIIGRASHEWLLGPAEAARLGAGRVDWVGLSDLAAPYEIVRRAPAFGHVLGCFGGEGEVWFGGGWRRVQAGMVFVNPPERAELLRAVPGARWQIGWAHTRAAFFARKGAATEPLLEERDARPFRHALEGLRLCVQADAKDALVAPWCELVVAHAGRLAARAAGEPRLARIWEEVAKAPGEPWDVERLCALAGLSREHLRRVSVQETGRTPMEQVTHLRMRRAADLLRFTRHTLEVVAEAVGYRSGFVFSNAFTRVMGARPGAYRAARAREAERGG